MKKQGRGKIVNISSLGARTGRPGGGCQLCRFQGCRHLHHANARAGGGACRHLCQRDRAWSDPDGADAPVPPEVFASGMLARAVTKDGLPEDVGDAVIFLGSKRSDWITGVTLDINGGILIR